MYKVAAILVDGKAGKNYFMAIRQTAPLSFSNIFADEPVLCFHQNQLVMLL